MPNLYIPATVLAFLEDSLLAFAYAVLLAGSVVFTDVVAFKLSDASLSDDCC